MRSPRAQSLAQLEKWPCRASELVAIGSGQTSRITEVPPHETAFRRRRRHRHAACARRCIRAASKACRSQVSHPSSSASRPRSSTSPCAEPWPCSAIRSSTTPIFRRFFGMPPDAAPQEREFRSAGSGVIVDAKNGYIVTNAHMVENATEITVALIDERELKAEVVGVGCALGRRGAAGQGRPLARRNPPGGFLETRGRRLRDRDRQPLRTAAQRHLRHRQRPRPLRHHPRRLRGFHPDRCRHQPRQFRRRAGQPGRRAGRHQFGDPVAIAAATWASASRFRRTWSARSWSS